MKFSGLIVISVSALLGTDSVNAFSPLPLGMGPGLGRAAVPLELRSATALASTPPFPGSSGAGGGQNYEQVLAGQTPSRAGGGLPGAAGAPTGSPLSADQRAPGAGGNLDPANNEGADRAAAQSLANMAAEVMKFPLDLPVERIDGSTTVRTYKIPVWAERVQYYLTTNGRPLKASVKLFIGPLRQVHLLKIDTEDGTIFPYRATLKFKKGASPTLSIETNSELEFPLWAAVALPSVERSEGLGKNTDNLWETNTKTKIQGGYIGEKGKSVGGAIRYFPIGAEYDAVQLIAWSKDVGKKSFRMKIEVLQGPNNPKQKFELQCGGGTQPYHSLIQTPGDGSVIRIQNLKFIEDGLVQVALIPVKY